MVNRAIHLFPDDILTIFYYSGYGGMTGITILQTLISYINRKDILRLMPCRFYLYNKNCNQPLYYGYG